MRLRYLGGDAVGHYNLQLARIHNELMRQLGQPLPHPTLPPLAPRSNAEYGVNYYREQRREKKAAAASSSAALTNTSSTTTSTAAITDTSTTPSASSALPAATLPSTLPAATIPGTVASPKLEAKAFSIPEAIDPTKLAAGYLRRPDSSGPAPKRLKPISSLEASDDLPGIKEGMVTFNKGSHYQLYGFKLRRTGEWVTPLCKPHQDLSKRCPGYKTSRKCADWCEYGIIKRARQARGIKD